MADTDIDLYADVDADFPGEELNTSGGGGAASDSGGDLYDDVLTSSVKDEGLKKEESPSGGGSLAPSSTPGTPGRRYQVYVGNLTWWTTDADISDSVASLGISDFLEVKFYENRANGQSKGYCCVSVGSEASLKILMEKMAKNELHGQAPVVTYATKTALQQFEAQSKTRPPSQPPPGPNTGRLPAPGMPRMRGPPPQVSRPPPGYRAPPPPGLRGLPPSIRLPPPPGLPPPHSAPPPVLAGPPPPRVVVPPPVGPAPHVNPAFFPNPPPLFSSQNLSEVEFEEIMSRNRTVSSSAIARAVQDASCNEYGSAIETLVTAISLIKQSKVANDDRCKILISSLQDTLHGIENKSYGARRERSRSRERGYRRHYSRERDYRDYYHHHHHRGERSRSREREYRRDYEERDRYKERERMDRMESSSGRMRGEDLRGEPAPRDKDRDRDRRH